MKLFNVRKGQFVYYNNELHRVYGVKPMYKKSVHLIRLRDLTQHLTNAASVEKYIPKESDSFIFNHKPYTLKKNQRAQVGDYILITNPAPDSLDHYSLNEVEIVESVDNKGVITTNSNGIKHKEYSLMVPGRTEDSTPIDYQNIENVSEENSNEVNALINHPHDNQLPMIGDVYKKNDPSELFEAMVIAIQGQTVFLGGGFEVSQEELMDSTKWIYLYHLNHK